MTNLGNLIIIAGIVLIVFGLAFSGRLGPLGNLPGDIRVQRGNWGLFFPIMSSIAISLILTLIFWIIGQLRR